MRPHSLNCYAFSKLWHRCNTIDLRVGDINFINKQAKTWLYADLLEKPEELALYRQPADGGLGLYHVQQRALANQINCFLETACNPSFRRNQYHHALYQYFILEENVLKPEIPPYFRGDFFPTIRRIKATPLNLSRITVKEIYRFLIEEITMTEEFERHNLNPLRVERSAPLVTWDRTWHLSRQHMLGPHLTSFLFKLLHQILPTAEHTSRILPNQSPLCTRCRMNEVETLIHTFFNCPGNQGMGLCLVNGIKKFIPTISPSNILTLDFQTPEENFFPLVWNTASFLSSLWQLRVDKKRVEMIKIRSEMEASCRLLRESRRVATMRILQEIF